MHLVANKLDFGASDRGRCAHNLGGALQNVSYKEDVTEQVNNGFTGISSGGGSGSTNAKGQIGDTYLGNYLDANSYRFFVQTVTIGDWGASWALVRGDPNPDDPAEGNKIEGDLESTFH